MSDDNPRRERIFKMLMTAYREAECSLSVEDGQHYALFSARLDNGQIGTATINIDTLASEIDRGLK
jgi:hypothetical protein